MIRIYIHFFHLNREQGHSNGQNQAAEKAEAKAREAKELAEEEAAICSDVCHILIGMFYPIYIDRGILGMVWNGYTTYFECG